MSLNIQQDVSLAACHTMACEATSAFFCRVQTEAELLEAVDWAQQKSMPILPLGQGSNVVFSCHYTGLVIQVCLEGVDINPREGGWQVCAAAGENWHKMVRQTVDRGLWGIENLSLIPGTVGAAPIQNIGAYGVELKDCFASLRALNLDTLKFTSFGLTECEFAYRESAYKNRLKGRYIITQVTLNLTEQHTPQLNYGPLQQAFVDDQEVLTPLRISDEVCRVRREKLPDPFDIPNSGSFFKNPILSVSAARDLQQQYPTLPVYPVDDTHVKLAAAWLIDKAGWRGTLDDGVGCYQHQALVLVNPGRRSGAEVVGFANRIQASVCKKFGVTLEMEPQVYPCITL